MGKYTKSSFAERDSRADSILERVHSNVCVPFSTTSKAKHRYYFIFLDEYFLKCWVFLCKKKDQTFTNFCDLKELVDKEFGKKVKSLWSDNDGEYVSNEFKNICAVEGIKQELIVPHNRQQNWVSKRKNKSIIGAARVMLHDQGLPLHLWPEACNTMVYVQNRSPHQVLDMKTPEHTYSSKRPDVRHFRIFGSSVYYHVTKDTWKNLEPTTELWIIMGCIDTPHNYQVYMPTS